MSLSVILVSVDASAGVRPLARSTDPELVRRVFLTLRDNRLHEDDEADVIYDPDFFVKLERRLACLTAQIRQDAADPLADVDNVDELDVDAADPL